MARLPRATPAGLVYHVLNRSAGRFTMFRHDRDYAAFMKVLHQAMERHPTRLLSYCLMPTHWHFVVYPQNDNDVSTFFRWLANTHAVRWRVAHDTVGYGALYQGRFKSFPVQRDDHLLTVCRYVERNPLTAGLVDRAESWPWSSLHARSSQNGADDPTRALLSDWPIDHPPSWTRTVNDPLTQKEVQRFQLSLRRGLPFGSDPWTQKTAAHLGLSQLLRPPGRPPKART